MKHTRKTKTKMRKNREKSDRKKHVPIKIEIYNELGSQNKDERKIERKNRQKVRKKHITHTCNFTKIILVKASIHFNDDIKI